jgi:hypothetical protein
MLPTELAGKYEERGTLGAGAMGTVVEAFDRMIERRVAVKLVKLPGGGDSEAEEAHARFRREAQAAGRLSHANIVGVYDYGENRDTAWIVMELVEGGTLKGVIDRGERMPVAEVVRLMDQVLAALAYSHGRGVVHRDIKPANIMLTGDRAGAASVKIADFGIARIESSTMTQVGTVMGTPSYMAPEQLRGEPVDARADIWAAGVVLYQLLTGEKPFEGNYTALLHRVLNTEPPPPSQLAVSAPRALDAVVARALAKRPADRFPSAAAFAEAMRAAAGPGIAAETTGGFDFAGAGRLPGLDDETMVAARPPTATPAPAPAPAPPAGKGGATKLLIGGGVVALVAAGAAAFFLMQEPTQTVVANLPASPPMAAPAVPAAPAPVAPLPAPPIAAPSPAAPAAVAPPSVSGPASPIAPPQLPAPAPTAPAFGAAGVPAAPAFGTATMPAAPPAPNPAATGLGVLAPPVPPAPMPSFALPAAVAPPVPPPAPLPAATATPSGPAAPDAAPAKPGAAPAASLSAAPQPAPTVAPNTVIAALPAPPAPVVPTAPLPTAVPVPPRIDFRAAAQAAASAAPCSLLDGSGTDQALRIAGPLRRGGEQQVRRVLAERGVPAPAATLALQPFDGPYCGVLDVIRQVAGAAEEAPRVELVGTMPLQHADLLRLDVQLPDRAGHLLVSYVMKSAEIVHLVPSEPQPPGARIRLGEPRPGFPGWEVDEPYGTDLILVFASDRPLFAQPRPVIEPLDNYLAALGAALRDARLLGGRVAARALVVETVQKR